MARFRRYSNLDDLGTIDGDGAFLGMDSRTNPAALQAGYVSLSKNMRFDRATAKPRKGAISQNLGIVLDTPPIVLPFYMPEEGVIIQNDYTDGSRTAGVYRGKAYPYDDLAFSKGGELRRAAFMSRGRTHAVSYGGFAKETVEKDYLILVFADKIYLFDPEEGRVIRTFEIPANAIIPHTDQIDVVQAFDRIVIFRGRDEDGDYLKPLFWNGDSDSEFEYAPDAEAYHSIPWSSWGEYSGGRLVVPLEYIKIDIESLVVSDEGKLATATTALDHGLKVGMKITIANAQTALLNGEKIITAVTNLEYEKDEDGENVLDENGEPIVNTQASFSYRAALDTDFTDTGAAFGAFSSRDEYVLSGILEPFEYDMVYGHFRVNKGSADSLVGITPYQEDSLIVFMRKSIYLHGGLNELQASGPLIVTDEVGCLSRKTIATIGKNIFFLSDEGVYSLEIAAQLDLTGAGEPLSRDIDDQIRRININFAHRACAVFCENRYYLAAPVDGSSRNNVIFIYNTLNRAWESIDVYPDSLYYDTLIVATCKGKKRVFATSNEGGIVMLEERDDGDEVGVIGSTAWDVAPVQAEIQTRMYGAKSTEVKRWIRLQSDITHQPGDKFELVAKLENPDSELSARTHESADEGEATLRHSVRRTAHRIKVIYKTTAGRPELREVVVEGNIKSSDNRKKE